VNYKRNNRWLAVELWQLECTIIFF
jgi:hypothetical protein